MTLLPYIVAMFAYSNATQSELPKQRTALISNAFLAKQARQNDLVPYLRYHDCNHSHWLIDGLSSSLPYSLSSFFHSLFYFSFNHSLTRSTTLSILFPLWNLYLCSATLSEQSTFIFHWKTRTIAPSSWNALLLIHRTKPTSPLTMESKCEQMCQTKYVQ